MNLLFTLCLMSMATVAAEENLEAPIAFKKLGYYAAGVRRGHLHIPINLGEVNHAIAQLAPELNALKKLLDGSTSNTTRKSKSAFLVMSLQETLLELDEAVDKITRMVQLPKAQPLAYSPDEISALLEYLKKFEKPARRAQRRMVKRQVEFLAMGLSLYNFYEINQISNQVEAQGRDIRILKHTVEKEVAITNSLVKAVNSYHTILSKFINELGNGMFEIYRTESYLQLNSHLQKMTLDLNLLIEALSDLFQGHLNPYIINWPQIEDPLSTLNKMADSRNWKPLFNEWGWVLNSPFSFFLDGPILKLFLHVPYYAENLYPIYQYLDLPIVSKKFKEDGMSLVVSPEKEFLAMDPKTHVGRTLKKSEIDSCAVFQLRNDKVYVCDDSSLIETRLDETCLGMLYMGLFEWSNLESKCNLKLAYPKPRFHVLSKNKIVYFLPTETEIRLDCTNITRIVVQRKIGMNVETVPDHCRLSAPEILFVPETGIEIEGEPWVFFRREIPFIHLTFDWSEGENALKLLSGQHKLTQLSLDEFRQHHWSETRHSAHWMTTAIVLLLLTLGIGGLGYFCYKRYWPKLRQSRSRLTQQDEKESEKMEDIELEKQSVRKKRKIVADAANDPLYYTVSCD